MRTLLLVRWISIGVVVHFMLRLCIVYCTV